MKIKTVAHTYEVLNYLRKDGLYNVYVQKTSNLSNTYIGEATYCIGVKEPETLNENDVINLSYSLY